MKVVIDTSAVIATITSERHQRVLVEATQGADLLAPSSLHAEGGNAFSAMFKRRRLTLEQALEALVLYRSIPIRQIDVDLEASLRLAHELGIYAYDAYVLACALHVGAPLLTLDGGMRTAASQAGIGVLEIPL